MVALENGCTVGRLDGRVPRCQCLFAGVRGSQGTRLLRQRKTSRRFSGSNVWERDLSREARREIDRHSCERSRE
jgi:hypothetical protein